MSDEDPLVNGQPLSSLRVVDLREELEKHGLSRSGNKKDLADRLKEFLVSGTMEESFVTKDKIPSTQSTPTKASPVAENQFVAQYRARQQAALKEAAAEKARRESESSDRLASPTHAKDVEEAFKADADVEGQSAPIDSQTDDIKKEVVNAEETEAKEEKVNAEESKEEEKNDQAEEIENVATPTDGSNDNVSSTDASDKNEDTTEAESPVTKDPTPSPSPKIIEESKKSPLLEESVDAKEEGVELDYGEGEDVAIEDEPKEEEKKDEDMEVDIAESKRKRRISIEAPKEEETEAKRSRQISPSRYPKSDILHIRGLMRPFTIPLLKAEICKQGGEILDFWIDSIRSHCFVKMRSDEEASAIREVLHGVHWPSSNPKALAVQFDNKENMDRYKSGKEALAAATASVSRTVSIDIHPVEKPTVVEKERRERPTLANLPGRNGSLRVTVEAMVRDNHKKEEEARERHEKEGKERTREIEKRIKLRQDREKQVQENKKREGSETPPHSRVVLEERKRDRKVTDEKRRDDRSRIESEPEKKEERQVKTADEFFKKTNAQPAIYYLPLTEEQAEARAAKRARDGR